MPIEVKRMLLEKVRLRYLKANKRQKSLILDEFILTCDISRKHAIRLLNRELRTRAYHAGPKFKYDKEVKKHLIILWQAMGRICSKKMVAALPIWLPFYSECSDETKYLLYQISSSTIDRSLREHRKESEKGKSSTIPSMLKNRIPIELLDSQITDVGFIEADTVVHCGNSLAGEFVNTLTMTDIFSGWTETRATWTKASDQVLRAIKNIEDDLPFKIRGFASDNGNEFLNYDLADYFHERKDKVHFVRRRPYQKNDNAHVEQKNWTHVRELLGYDRFDQEWDVSYINDIYRSYWNPLWNYFNPVMKLQEKTRIGGKVIKVHDKPKTPYQRLMDSKQLTEDQQLKLETQMKGLNPFTLKKELDEKLRWFFRIIDIRKRQSLATG